MSSYYLRCRNGKSMLSFGCDKEADSDDVLSAFEPRGKSGGGRAKFPRSSRTNLCRCEGPLGRDGTPFPHRVTHPFCDHHPLGPYNQSRRLLIDGTGTTALCRTTQRLSVRTRRAGGKSRA